jgi:GT2 family glycosyltransferase
MKVFVIVPVFNRLAQTRAIIDCLRRQVGVTLQIVVINDGSTDGTEAYLAAQEDILTLRGNGRLWWAGAIDLALRAIHPMLLPGDFFAFLNNDTRVDDDFLAVLVATSLRKRAAVGSIIRTLQPPHRILDIGPRANLWKMWIWDIAADVPTGELEQPNETYRVDFLSGRGTLYPAEVLDHVGFMRPLLLPHYHADYEFSDRVRRAGFPLLVASRAVTYSDEDFGNQRRAASFWRRKFGKGSPDNALQKIAFFLLVGTPAQRWSAIPRMLAPPAMALRSRFQCLVLKRVLLPAKVFLGRVVPWGLLPTKVHLGRFMRLALLPVKLARTYSVSLGERLGFLLASLRSSIARARVLAALERRGPRRLEALHVYAAALLTELQQGKVVLLGPAAQRHQPFFRRLRVATAVLSETSRDLADDGADLVFCVLDTFNPAEPLPQPESLMQHVRPGGVLYCACYAGPQVPGVIKQLLDGLVQMPTIGVLADGMAGWPRADHHGPLFPDCAFPVRPTAHGDAPPARFLAAQRLR